MDGNGRNGNGRFATGNPGGPGRPRRAVEREYLAALGDAVPLDTWKAICKRAADDALAGDCKARAWLAEVLLRGVNFMPLSELAAAEAVGETGDDVVEAKAREVGRRQQWAEKTFKALGKLAK